MGQVRTLARSFAGGEVTPEFWGRIDDGKYQTGLALARNFIPMPHGPVQNRAGFAFVRETKASANRSVVRPFSYSATQTMVLEFGDGYVRFHTAGATLLRSGVAAYNGATAYTPGDLVSQGGTDYVNILAVTGTAPPNATYWYAQPATGEYEIPSPYATADVPTLRFTQSLDVLTITHTGYLPRELRRAGALKWYFTSVSFVSALAAPAGIGSTATQPTAGATKDATYVVTAVGSGADESLPSAPTTEANLLTGIGNFNTITWSAVAGATRYNVYKIEGGIYGFIGQASGLSFVDDNISADTAYCPPENVNPFSSAGNYPAAVEYHEQRRCFAGTTNQPQNFWGTRSGTESNLQYAIPTREDDALQFKIAARKNQSIRHLVSMQDLLIFTVSAVWRVRAGGDALTPTSFNVKPQSYVGCSEVAPLAIDTTVLFAAARGGHVRELGFNNDAGGWITGDLSLRCPHRFDNKTIVDAAFSLSPYPIAWFVSSAGNLLSLTYVPEQNIGAWASHDTDGVFESCCVVAEDDEDVLYVVVQRTINASTKRYIERLASRQFEALEDAFFVDSGLSYDGAPADTFSGLGHLEGETVSILGDGAVFPQQVVTGGAVTIDTDVSKAHIGLPITADFQTLPMAVEAQAFAQGRTKNVNKVFLRVYQSGGIKAGPALDALREFPARTSEVFGSPPDLRTGECEIMLDPQWDDGGQVYVRQSDPLPLTVVSMTLEAEIAG
jgi:hypothetical protein